MESEVAECQVPSATDTGPIVQVYEFEGKKRLVVALPSSAILVSQEWLTHIAGWTFVSGPKPGLEGSVCENTAHRAGANKSYKLSMKNGLPYLSRELFWLGMKDAFDRAKQMGLSPEQAARQITPTPAGQFALYDAKKGEIVKSDRWRPPDFRSLIKIAQTEQGRSEVSCVFEEHQSVMMAKPAIFSEETGPTHFTFAHQIDR